MADQKRSSAVDKPSPNPPPQPPKPYPGSGSSSNNTHHHHVPRGFPNPPDAANPDPATLREQWRFAIRQYSRWYSHAWGTAILAGVSFFALGWFIKGSNPFLLDLTIRMKANRENVAELELSGQHSEHKQTVNSTSLD